MVTDAQIDPEIVSDHIAHTGMKSAGIARNPCPQIEGLSKEVLGSQFHFRRKIDVLLCLEINTCRFRRVIADSRSKPHGKADRIVCADFYWILHKCPNTDGTRDLVL